jgi:hypothetical protein
LGCLRVVHPCPVDPEGPLARVVRASPEAPVGQLAPEDPAILEGLASREDPEGKGERLSKILMAFIAHSWCGQHFMCHRAGEYGRGGSWGLEKY